MTVVAELMERPKRAAIAYCAAFALIVVAIYLYWPAGIVLSLLAGVAAVLSIGRRMQAESAVVHHDELPLQRTVDEELRDDIRQLRFTLGAEYPDFVRAALLVADSQWASAAALQRGLSVPYVTARRLLDLLEAEGFVGPMHGTRERAVLLAPEHRPALQRLLTAR